MIERRARLLPYVAGLLALGLLASCSRVSGLPAVPAELTAEQAGVDGLVAYAAAAERLNRPLADAERARFGDAAPGDPIDRARWAVDRWAAAGQAETALALLGQLYAENPRDLLIGNRYRMLVHEIKRTQLRELKLAGQRTPRLPGYLADQPFELLERLAAEQPGREVRFQLAMAYVDVMVLNPALEIKAPASVDSVGLLSSILDGDDPYYVPALFARGLNYLHRPRNLVWPEKPPPPGDAASRDFSLAAAVGARVGGAPDPLRGRMLLTLGDAYANEDAIGLARSWWMTARELTADPGVRHELALRMQWNDDEIAERLEERRDERMNDQERPFGDLSFMWLAEEARNR